MATSAALGGNNAGPLSLNGGTLDLNSYGVTVPSLSGSSGVISDYSSGSGTTTLTVSRSSATAFAGSRGQRHQQDPGPDHERQWNADPLRQQHVYRADEHHRRHPGRQRLAGRRQPSPSATPATLAGSGVVGGNATLTGNGAINLSGGTLGGTLGATGGNWNGTGTRRRPGHLQQQPVHRRQRPLTATAAWRSNGGLDRVGTISGNATLAATPINSRAADGGTLGVTGGNWNGTGTVGGLITPAGDCYDRQRRDSGGQRRTEPQRRDLDRRGHDLRRHRDPGRGGLDRPGRDSRPTAASAP